MLNQYLILLSVMVGWDKKEKCHEFLFGTMLLLQDILSVYNKKSGNAIAYQFFTFIKDGSEFNDM